MDTPAVIEKWHQLVANRDPAALQALLAEDAQFWSPVLHKPQQGRNLVMMYLGGAMQVIGNEHFRYVREIYGDHDACLEFTTEFEGLVVNGVDLIQWNEAGQITDFKVMLRPQRALQAVQQGMAALLASMGGKLPTPAVPAGTAPAPAPSSGERPG